MSNSNNSPTDQILDLLLDALQARQKEQTMSDKIPLVETAVPPNPPTREPLPEVAEVEEEHDEVMELVEAVEVEEEHDEELDLVEAGEVEVEGDSAMEEIVEEIEAETAVYHFEKLPPVHLDKLLGRLLLWMFLLLIVINIPYNRFGTNLARAMPDTDALVIRDGVLLQGSGEEVYVLEDNQLRWITSLDAFQWYGYRWEQVHQVEDEFLDEFIEGRPLYLLQKCSGPHVYAMENGEKRWIKDIPTFQAQGFVWQDIRIVDCNYLRRLPDGLPIPEDAGEPPQPQP